MKGTHLGGPVLQSAQVAGARQFFSNLPAHGDPGYVIYYNDFLVNQDYATTDWTLTDIGSATRALSASEKNGALLITNAAANLDSASMQQVQSAYNLQAGKKLWFEARLQINDPTLVNMVIGLTNTDTTPFDANEAVTWQLSSNAIPYAVTSLGGVATTTFSDKAMVADTYANLGFYWDGNNRVEFYHNRKIKATHNSNIPIVNLTLTSLIANAEAVAKTKTLDYVFVCMER